MAKISTNDFISEMEKIIQASGSENIESIGGYSPQEFARYVVLGSKQIKLKDESPMLSTFKVSYEQIMKNAALFDSRVEINKLIEKTCFANGLTAKQFDKTFGSIMSEINEKASSKPTTDFKYVAKLEGQMRATKLYMQNNILSRSNLTEQLFNLEQSYSNTFPVSSGMNKQFIQLKNEILGFHSTSGDDYKINKDSDIYKLIMSGNDKAISRLIETMVKESKISTNSVPNPLGPKKDDLATLILENSPPELSIKFAEIASKVEQRLDPKKKPSKFSDLINKFANFAKLLTGKSINTGMISNAFKDLDGKINLLKADNPALSKYKTKEPNKDVNATKNLIIR